MGCGQPRGPQYICIIDASHGYATIQNVYFEIDYLVNVQQLKKYCLTSQMLYLSLVLGTSSIFSPSQKHSSQILFAKLFPIDWKRLITDGSFTSRVKDRTCSKHMAKVDVWNPQHLETKTFISSIEDLTCSMHTIEVHINKPNNMWK